MSWNSRRKMLRLAGASVLAPGQVFANTVSEANESPPPEVAAALGLARLQGQARMRFWGMDIYDAYLWRGRVFDPPRYATQPFALELRYKRKLEGKAIARRSLEEMRKLEAIDARDAQLWLSFMERAFPDVANGNRLTGLHLPNEGTRFFTDGRPGAELPDPRFARLFFGIWLAPGSSEPELRRKLTGSPE